MLTKKSTENREEQTMFACIDDFVPQDHILRKIDTVLNFDFIYDLVADKYSPNHGRPSVDPVVLIKIVLIQYMFGIPSMRQTINEIQVNLAYRWFLGFGFNDTVPHFSTFAKNYARRFENTDLFERIFIEVLFACKRVGFVKEDTVYVDATHVKASANKNKSRKKTVKKEVYAYARELREEINQDREDHGKEPFDDDDPPTEEKMITESTTDPECGMFVKGEHERQFAYNVQTACDRYGFVLGYEVFPGNVHDSASFEKFYRVLSTEKVKTMVMDAGYTAPHILRRLLLDKIKPLTPYMRPKTKDGYFKKYEYVYDEYYDRYICPQNHVLPYATTNRDGYREYKSLSYHCEKCPELSRCTNSQDHTKTITQHVWNDYIEQAADIRYGLGMKEVYKRRKETIERVFADAKEKHGMRYTQYRGRAKVKMEVGLIYTCMNLKKLARWLIPDGTLGGGKRLASSLNQLLASISQRSKAKLRANPALSFTFVNTLGAGNSGSFFRGEIW